MSFMFLADPRNAFALPRWSLVLASMLIVFAGWATGQTLPARVSVIQQHYDMAQTMQTTGNLPEAAHQYRLFIADALGEMALQAANLAQFGKAAPLFDESLRLAPNSPGLKVRYAQAALAAQDFSKTKKLTEEILRDNPTNAKAVMKAHLLMGWALLRADQEADARKHFEAAVALEPNFENGYALAIACLDLGDGACAAKVFGEMIAGLGDTAVLHMEIGRAYLNSDFQQQAPAEFKKAIAIDNDIAGAHYALATAYLTLGGEGSAEAAKTELKAELKASPNDALSHAQLGNIALRERDYVTAEQELKKAVGLNAQSSQVFLYLGQLYEDTDRSNEAVDAFRRSILLTADPAYNRYQVQKVHYLLGHLLIKLGKTGEGDQELQVSAALLNRSLKRDRDRLNGYLDGANSPEGSGNIHAMTTGAPPATKSTPDSLELDAYEKRLTPALADSYNNLGVIAAGNDEFVEALTDFSHAFNWNSQLEGLDANWSRAALSSGHYSIAIPPLTRQLDANPEDFALRSELAISLFKTWDYSGVVRILEQVSDRLDPVPGLACMLGTSLLKTGSYEAGIKLLLRIETVHPEMAEVHTRLGEAYQEAEDLPHAATELSLSIKINPNDPSVYRDLGLVQLNQSDFPQAIQNLKIASKLDPLNVETHRYLALAYRKSLRSHDADREQAICEALDKAPQTGKTITPN